MKKIIIILASILLSTNSSASYLKECGTGHIVAGDALGGYAAVSINLSSSTSDASTSRLSTPELCGKSLWSAAKFINTNLPMIEQDTANGGGEYIYAMMDILSCNQSTRKSIIKDIRSEFSKYVANENYSTLPRQEKVKSYFDIMSKEVSKSSSQCNIV